MTSRHPSGHVWPHLVVETFWFQAKVPPTAMRSYYYCIIIAVRYRMIKRIRARDPMDQSAAYSVWTIDTYTQPCEMASRKPQTDHRIAVHSPRSPGPVPLCSSWLGQPLEQFYADWNRRPRLSLRGAQRRRPYVLAELEATHPRCGYEGCPGCSGQSLTQGG